MRASSNVRLKNPIAGKTGFCPRLFCGSAGLAEDLDMLKATTPAPAAAATPSVAGEIEERSLRGAAISRKQTLDGCQIVVENAESRSEIGVGTSLE